GETMPLIEAALAFAITMLALSLIVSSFVEIIHRALKLREKGLKYMLEQLFDQVLAKYVEPLAKSAPEKAEKALAEAKAELTAKELATPHDRKGLKPLEVEVKALGAAVETTKTLEGAYKFVRDAFVERMRVNRAPVGLKTDPSLAVIR